jgi:hypothetical protein
MKTEKQITRKYPRNWDEQQEQIAAADMVVVDGYDGHTYMIDTRGVELTDKGVKWHYANRASHYEITGRLLRKLQTQYNVVTNYY